MPFDHAVPSQTHPSSPPQEVEYVGLIRLGQELLHLLYSILHVLDVVLHLGDVLLHLGDVVLRLDAYLLNHQLESTRCIVDLSFEAVRPCLGISVKALNEPCVRCRRFSQNHCAHRSRHCACEDANHTRHIWDAEASCPPEGQT